MRWVLAMLLAFAASAPAWAERSGSWPMFGQNLQNTAAVSSARPIDPRRLAPKWIFRTGGDVSARAAVVDDVVYFPDWGGNLWAVDARNGRKKWGRQLSQYGLTGSASGVYTSRTSPAVEDGVVYVATQEGAWLLAIRAASGRLLWKAQLESPANDPHAMITTSPAVYRGRVYIGVTSSEEGLAGLVPNFPCCKGRGSVVAVDARSGAIAWQTYTVPEGYSGAGVWGSNFVVDAKRNTVYASTGNNFSVPSDPAYRACIAAGSSAAACQSPDNHVDSVLALDLDTGRIKWARRLVQWAQPGVVDGSDAWNVSCVIPSFANCPGGAGPDYDFASAPNLITYRDADGRRRTILGAGQKSGIYFALDPDTGATLWQTQVGPGSTLGGIEWGSASDGRRIYVAIANLYGIPTAAGGAGFWAALDPANGKILWQTGDPNGAIALGPVSVADGVVYVASMAGKPDAPTMLALKASTGQVLWTYAAGGSVNAGASIVDGVVYWGSGYAHLGIPGYTGNSRFYAFATGRLAR